MAIALVSAGSLLSGQSTTISPSFGATTGSGHLLIAQISGGSGSAWSTSASGWVLALSGAASPGMCIFYKANCGAGESAPSFTNSGAVAGQSCGVLSEWSGAATSSPVDRSGDTTASGSLTVAASAADTNTGDVAFVVCQQTSSKTATCTFSSSWTPAGGTAGSNGDTGATSGTFWSFLPYYLLGGNGGGAADTDTVTATPNKGTPTPNGGIIVSFLPAAAAAPNAPKPRQTMNQSVNRAGTY
jgi:hypothetical protein